MVLGLSLINAHTTRAFGFMDQPNVVGMTDCAPLTSVDVTLTNKADNDPCSGCATWYISVWEWDGGSGYQQIGSPLAFSSGPPYSWTGLTWDYTNYPCLVLIWHYKSIGGANGCGYSTPDQYHSQCWYGGNPPSTWPVSDFYPC